MWLNELEEGRSRSGAAGPGANLTGGKYGHLLKMGRADMRIVSLLPSCTKIVMSLGLRDHLYGVTHECVIDGTTEERGGILRVTKSVIQIETTSQKDIDLAVKESLHSGISLYTIDVDRFERALPTIVLTQNLCTVCAPSKAEIEQVTEEVSNRSCGYADYKIVSLEPTCVEEVVNTFLTVAEVCGVRERGLALQQLFRSQLSSVTDAAKRVTESGVAKPSVLVLEWLDPPFDSGHWVPDIVEAAGCTLPETFGGKQRRSQQRPWKDIVRSDPDVILVSCCGFDLQRNIEDVWKLWEARGTLACESFRSLRAVRTGRVFAVDADQYFAQPSPCLAQGSAIIARCAFDFDQKATEQLCAELGDLIPLEGMAWRRLDLPDDDDEAAALPAAQVVDVEDSAELVWKVHDEAARQGKMFYTDPQTGLMVFTSYAHKGRRRCCGSGCRHCPFGHANVSLEARAERIQQPAFLHERSRAEGAAVGGPISVVFFSTGKDSFLALRRWIAEKREELASSPSDVLDSIVLLTSFDVQSRMIAHQDTSVKDAQRQARHLDLDLVGVPLQPGADYVRTIEAAVELIRIERQAEEVELVFGDLHLEEIKSWRDGALGHLGALRYPLFRVPYDTLFEDLIDSGVPCYITSCEFGSKLHAQPCPEVRAGRRFDEGLREACRRCGWDQFGENGEFHTLAHVWEADPLSALGLE